MMNRMMPTTWMLIPSASADTAQARIAPAARKTRLAATPIFLSFHLSAHNNEGAFEVVRIAIDVSPSIHSTLRRFFFAMFTADGGAAVNAYASAGRYVQAPNGECGEVAPHMAGFTPIFILLLRAHIALM
jgi:hypothetical protein